MNQSRMYGELASWWPLLSPPEDYEEEGAAFFTARGIVPVTISSVDVAIELAGSKTDRESRSQLLRTIGAAGKSPQQDNQIIAETVSQLRDYRFY